MTATDPNRRRAFGQTRSLANSAINVIMELQEHAETARQEGREDESEALTLKANEIARESARIARAEALMRNKKSLKPVVIKLQGLAADGRRAMGRIKKLGKAIQAATDFLGVLLKLTNVFI